MSLDTFPFIYLNLGGEMMYIIQQRLEAQKICPVKADKVLNDILQAMFEMISTESVFEKQPLKDRDYIQQIFQKIAHSSIMKLNEQSMSKLLELMTMVFKYQLVFCLSPFDLYEMTLNHINALLLMTNQSHIHEQILATRVKFSQACEAYDERHYILIRQTLLNYLIDIKTRVSIFLREKTQQLDGSFVLINTEGVTLCKYDPPGKIFYYGANESEVIRESTFDNSVAYVRERSKTVLGLNIYGKEDDSPKPSSPDKGTDNDNYHPFDESLPSAQECKQEFELLSAMLGKRKKSLEAVKVDLCISEDEPETTNQQTTGVKEIEVNNQREKLQKICEDFVVDEDDTTQDASNEDDLLHLIDMNS